MCCTPALSEIKTFLTPHFGENCRLLEKSSHLSSKIAKSCCELCPQEQWAVLRALQQLKFMTPRVGKACTDISDFVIEIGRFSYLG